jgi:hypothetical protein
MLHDSGVSGRLFFLDAGAGRVMSVNPDGSDLCAHRSQGQAHVHHRLRGFGISSQSRRVGPKKTLLFAQGNVTGIAYAEIQAQPPATRR